MKGITVSKPAEVAQCPRNPLIGKVLSSIKSETGEENTFQLPKLGYEYNGLEPTICSEIMQIHHSKVKMSSTRPWVKKYFQHHNGYVNNLNAAVAKLAEAEKAGDTNAINQRMLKIN